MSLIKKVCEKNGFELVDLKDFLIASWEYLERMPLEWSIGDIMTSTKMLENLYQTGERSIVLVVNRVFLADLYEFLGLFDQKMKNKELLNELKQANDE